MEFLLSKGALKISNKHGDNRLHSFKRGLAISSDGFSPLMLAVQNGYEAVCRLLIVYGSDLDEKQPISGHTAVHDASIRGHHKILVDLLTYGASVDFQEYVAGNTALKIACQMGYLDCVLSLLKANADMYLPDIYGFFPIHMAAENNRDSVVQALLDHGCDKDLVSRNTI